MKQLYSIILIVLLTGCSTLDRVTGKTAEETETVKEAETAKAMPATVKAESQAAKVESPAAVDPATAIRIQSTIPFKSGNRIASNIKSECELGNRLSDALGIFASKKSIGLVKVDKIDTGARGKVLYVEITDAVSSGNAFIGHRKFSSAAGTLYNNGKKQAAFTAARISGGGFFGGYMGSCAVLGRTTKVIARDIIKWLENPVDGAHLGDRI